MDTLLIGNSVFMIPPYGPGRYGWNCAYLCSVCGNIWARRISEQQPTTWYSVYFTCEKCQPRFAGDVPGSLLDTYDSGLSCPNSLLEREFIVHCQLLRRTQ
jgi:hypothetical protein